MGSVLGKRTFPASDRLLLGAGPVFPLRRSQAHANLIL
jgi:hypothetical protein